MKAVIYNKKSEHKFSISEIETPVPKDDQVLVKIICTSLNAADYRSVKMGLVPKSKIFGSAISGVVESVGSEVKNFKPGDEVLGGIADHGFGGMAEFVALPERALAKKAISVTFEDAASLPVASTTALKALRNKGDIKTGQSVMIVGGSGAVGLFCIQLAKHFGGIVTAVCSTRNLELAKSVGADEVIDYTQEDFMKSKGAFDLVIGVNGNYPLMGYKRTLKPGGTCVILGGSLRQIFKAMFFGRFLSLGSKKVTILSSKSDPQTLDLVMDLMARGKIRAIIEKRYSLEEASQAMEFISQGHAQGKVILKISEN